MEEKEERLKNQKQLLIPTPVPTKTVPRRVVPRVRIPVPVRPAPIRIPVPVRPRRKRKRMVGDYRYSSCGGCWYRDKPFHVRFSTPRSDASLYLDGLSRPKKSSFYTDPLLPARPYFASPTTFIQVFDKEEPTQFGKRKDKTERKRWCIKWGPPKKRGKRKGRFEIPAKRFRRLRSVSRRQERASKLQRHFQF